MLLCLIAILSRCIQTMQEVRHVYHHQQFFGRLRILSRLRAE